MIQEICKITANKRIAPGHFVLTFASKAIAKTAKPGQFVQILCADSNDPLLPRPFSFLDVQNDKVSILYHVVGRGTAILGSVKSGETLKILGPLGNGFTLEAEGRKVVLVGGGVGIPPLFHLAKQLISRKIKKPSEITVLLGARTQAFLLCEKEFKKLGVSLRVATDDGSKGRKGLVTELLKDVLNSAPISFLPSFYVYTCGPTPMMRAVAGLAEKGGVPCEVSVEVPMACGFGACLGCAVEVKSAAGGHRFAIACCEGPVFKGDEIIWS